jgi:glycosyltransferase involved in cell wall biosynthesis
MPLIDQLRQSHIWPVVYDCLDDQEAFSKTYGVSGIREEEKLVAACDELIVTSAALQARWQARRADISLLPNACDYPLFSAPPKCPLPLAVRQPVIGYYGTLSERMDLTLLRAVAEARPEWQFVFVGRASFARQPREWWELTRLANIHVLPPVEQRTLAGYVSQFQVCLLPFHDNQMTRAMNFVKLYEYLAAGKPVVSAQLREVVPFAEQGLVHIYHDIDGFIDQVETCLREPPPADAARRFVSEQTWEARVDVLEQIITRLSTSRGTG